MGTLVTSTRKPVCCSSIVAHAHLTRWSELDLYGGFEPDELAEVLDFPFWQCKISMFTPGTATVLPLLRGDRRAWSEPLMIVVSRI